MDSNQIKWEDVKPGMKIAVYFDAEHLMGVYEAQSEAEIVHGHQAFIGDVSAVYVKVEGQQNSKQFNEGMIVILVEGNEEEIKATFEAFQAKQAEKVALLDIMTTAEVAKEFGIADATVRQAIGHGFIEARQSGSTWLLRRADATKRWGNRPRKPISFTYWLGDGRPEVPAHDVEYKDSNGNILRILERDGEDIGYADSDVVNHLDEYGYDGPGDWDLA